VGGKAIGCEINHSAPSSAEIKNEWSCTFSPSVVLLGVDRENFPFLYLCKATINWIDLMIMDGKGLDIQK